MKMSTFRDAKKSLRTATKKIFGQNNCTSKEVTPVLSVKADRAPHGGMCHMGAWRSCQAERVSAGSKTTTGNFLLPHLEI